MTQRHRFEGNDIASETPIYNAIAPLKSSVQPPLPSPTLSEPTSTSTHPPSRTSSSGTVPIASSAPSQSAASIWRQSQSSPSRESNMLWMELESNMSETYVRSLPTSCGWAGATIKWIPNKTGGTNAGYCFIIFPSASKAAEMLPVISTQTMPGTTRRFKLNWAAPPASAVTAMSSTGERVRLDEHSVFVGDLASETSEADLIQAFQAVGFTSCRNAKIMVDVAGVGKGYGFVRFGDEAEMQRALTDHQNNIQCCGRTIRLSTASSKNKASLGLSIGPGGATNANASPTLLSLGLGTPILGSAPLSPHVFSPALASPSLGVYNSLPVSPAGQTASLGYPYPPYPYMHIPASSLPNLPNMAAAAQTVFPISSDLQGYMIAQPGGSSSAPTTVSDAAVYHPQTTTTTNLPPPMVPNNSVQASSTTQNGSNSPYEPLFAPGVSTAGISAAQLQAAQVVQAQVQAQLQAQYQVQLQAQAHAHALSQVQLLSQTPNMAPSGLSGNSDPNNTTVFVGGLGGNISETVLRQYFAPFGEVTYVKIPPGKGCGFVQFVRKQDAERAIERMQGFPIGESRIRTSWGRSQSDKAAQMVTQAASLGLGYNALHQLANLTPSQAAQLSIALQDMNHTKPSAPLPPISMSTNAFSQSTRPISRHEDQENIRIPDYDTAFGPYSGSFRKTERDRGDLYGLKSPTFSNNMGSFAASGRLNDYPLDPLDIGGMSISGSAPGPISPPLSRNSFTMKSSSQEPKRLSQQDPSQYGVEANLPWKY